LERGHGNPQYRGFPFDRLHQGDVIPFTKEAKMKRVLVVVGLLMVVGGVSVVASTAQAQPYPNRPIQLIIPIPAGGGGDVNARLLIEELGKILGTQIVAVNKPGAADTLGTNATAKSKNDGYTIGYTGSAALVAGRIMNPENVHYDSLKDFDHLGLHVYFPLALAVQASSPWKTFGELVDYAKKNPGKIRVSTIGVGGMSHLNVELMQSLTGTQLTHIPFKGGEAVTAALLGGHVEASADAIGKFMPHVDAGKLRVLVLSRKFSLVPNVPTMKELGYKEDLFSSWFSLTAPAGIPEEAKKVLIPAIEKSINNPALKTKIENRGYIVDYKSPAELRNIIANDYETIRALAVRLGLAK
jgi:tripartite-type tricarboxylate transporter receptor subunit TctC